ncbi:MAG: flavodoxin family protein [Candidatus Saccharibacteria bacterium]|jgi:multimeric flavodoxin WrbA|nr:flavodoxin family protein [Candidatus Saccharibacteria bacterium]
MTQTYNFSDLKVLFFNGTLKKSPERSNTDGLIDASRQLLQHLNVTSEVIRTVDLDIATGVYPDMRERGWQTDAWAESIYQKVLDADIVILAGPIWLGDNSSQMKKIIERLYGNSAEVNAAGQWIYYGKVGGCLIGGNEDGLKHCAMNVLYSLQHIGFTIPPQADAGWIGEVGPGPSYLDKGSRGPENDFTNRNITFMTYNLLHTARRLKDNGGIPAEGNVASAWKQGERYGFTNPNRT